LKLDRVTRRRLEKLDRKCTDADRRVRIRVVLKVASGLSRNAAAREVGCVPSTAVRTVARFQREGEASLVDHRCENGVRKVDEDLLERVRTILGGRPSAHGFERPTWTLEILRTVIAQVAGVGLSITHVWRLLRRLGARWGRPRPVVACPWKAARRQRRIAALRRLVNHCPADEVVLFADEVDIHLNPKIGPDWMLAGTQRLVMTPGNNEKRYLAGAFDPVRGELVYVEGDRKASWLFLHLLRALLETYDRMQTIHVILDNFVIHKSHIVRSWLAECGRRLRLHFLPPYCPAENRIERLWQDLHANVTRNHDARSIQELMRRAHRYLADRFNVHRGMLIAA
jgi:transposase